MIVPALFALLITVGAGYEVWAIWVEHNDRDRRVKLTISSFVASHPHAAILLGLALFTLFGYALGRGGP